MTQDDLHILLADAVKNGASDVHIKAGTPPAYRVNGILKPVKYRRLMPSDTEFIALLVISDPDLQKRIHEVQEHDTSFSLSGVARFRVNIYRQRGSLALILRVIPSKVPALAELGVSPLVRELAELDRGLILVTGTTGSGKTSTLAGMISHINHNRRAHILTIEDPIEFLHQNVQASVSQREIGLDTKSSKLALRSALRQDPDVIFVSEVRDGECLDMLLKASEGGRLVLSSALTTDPPKTIAWLVSLFPAEEQTVARQRLADNLRAIVSQRLLPRTDGSGRELHCEVLVVDAAIKEALREPDKLERLPSRLERAR